VWGRWRHLLWWWRWWYWSVEVDRIWHALCIMRMKLIVKYCFLADVLYLEGHLDYGHHTSVYIRYLCCLLVCFCSNACSWFHILLMQFFVDVSFHTMLRNLWKVWGSSYSHSNKGFLSCVFECGMHYDLLGWVLCNYISSHFFGVSS
jgi:hypothetical protein